jgi:hypothetical protein
MTQGAALLFLSATPCARNARTGRDVPGSFMGTAATVKIGP